MIVAAPHRTLSATVALVADCCGLSTAALYGRVRIRRVAVPRAIAIGVVYDGPGRRSETRSTTVIARRFGGRDHSTISNAVRNYRGWCRAAGLAAATDDPATQAKVLMAHLGINPRPISDRDLTSASTKTKKVEIMAASTQRLTVPRDNPEFGVFAISAAEFDALPPAARTDAARLALERAGSAEAAQVMTGVSAACLWRNATASPRPVSAIIPEPPAHRLAERGPAGGVADAEPCRANRSKALLETVGDAAAATVDGSFSRFASIHIGAGPGGIGVADAYATYRAFCARQDLGAMPRAAFGAWLGRMARERGGARRGDRITDAGLVLIDGISAPACEAIRTPPRPVAPTPRHRPPIVLGWQPRRHAGCRGVVISDDGTRSEGRRKV